MAQVLQIMLRTLKLENPMVVEQMLQESRAKADVNLKPPVEEELADSNSLEAKIEREVKKFVAIAEQKLAQRTHVEQTQMAQLVKRQQQMSEQHLDSRADQIQAYVHEMHQLQMAEQKNYQDCYTQYLHSKQQFDRKLAAVVHIEHNNIDLLKQIKNLHDIIAQLCQASLAVIHPAASPRALVKPRRNTVAQLPIGPFLVAPDTQSDTESSASESEPEAVKKLKTAVNKKTRNLPFKSQDILVDRPSTQMHRDSFRVSGTTVPGFANQKPQATAKDEALRKKIRQI